MYNDNYIQNTELENKINQNIMHSPIHNLSTNDNITPTNTNLNTNFFNSKSNFNNQITAQNESFTGADDYVNFTII